jgi:hypothetical protein
MRLRPAKHMNSLVWLVWHMARAEDVFVNLVVARGDQVLDEVWVKRLAVARWDIGTGMTEPEVTESSDQVNIAAVIRYRDAVGQRSREFVARMQPEGWAGAVEAGDVQSAIAARAFGPRADWLEKAFQGRTRAGVLAAIMIVHNAEHLGEAHCPELSRSRPPDVTRTYLGEVQPHCDTNGRACLPSNAIGYLELN